MPDLGDLSFSTTVDTGNTIEKLDAVTASLERVEEASKKLSKKTTLGSFYTDTRTTKQDKMFPSTIDDRFKADRLNVARSNLLAKTNDVSATVKQNSALLNNSKQITSNINATTKYAEKLAIARKASDDFSRAQKKTGNTLFDAYTATEHSRTGLEQLTRAEAGEGGASKGRKTKAINAANAFSDVTKEADLQHNALKGAQVDMKAYISTLEKGVKKTEAWNKLATRASTKGITVKTPQMEKFIGDMQKTGTMGDEAKIQSLNKYKKLYDTTLAQSANFTKEQRVQNKLLSQYDDLAEKASLTRAETSSPSQLKWSKDTLATSGMSDTQKAKAVGNIGKAYKEANADAEVYKLTQKQIAIDEKTFNNSKRKIEKMTTNASYINPEAYSKPMVEYGKFAEDFAKMDVKDQVANMGQLTRRYKEAVEQSKILTAQEKKRGEVAKKAKQEESARMQAQRASFSMLMSSLRDVSIMLRQVGTFMTRFVSVPLALIGASSIKYTAEMEMQQKAFDILLSSAVKGAEVYGKVVKYAALTPYQLPELTQATKELLAYGSSSTVVMDQLRRLGDIAQNDSEKLQSVVQAFGKVEARGVAHMRELNRFIMAGVPIISTLGEVMNLSAEDLFSAVQKGNVHFSAVSQALTKMTNEGGKFFNMSAEMAQLVAGRWSTLQDEANLMVRSFVIDWMPTILEAINYTITFAQAIQALTKSQRDSIVQVLKLIVTLGPLLLMLGKLVQMSMIIEKIFTRLMTVSTGFNVFATALGLTAGKVAVILTVITALAGAAAWFILKDKITGVTDAYLGFNTMVKTIDKKQSNKEIASLFETYKGERIMTADIVKQYRDTEYKQTGDFSGLGDRYNEIKASRDKILVAQEAYDKEYNTYMSTLADTMVGSRTKAPTRDELVSMDAYVAKDNGDYSGFIDPQMIKEAKWRYENATKEVRAEYDKQILKGYSDYGVESHLAELNATLNKVRVAENDKIKELSPDLSLRGKIAEAMFGAGAGTSVASGVKGMNSKDALMTMVKTLISDTGLAIETELGKLVKYKAISPEANIVNELLSSRFTPTSDGSTKIIDALKVEVDKLGIASNSVINEYIKTVKSRDFNSAVQELYDSFKNGFKTDSPAYMMADTVFSGFGSKSELREASALYAEFGRLVSEGGDNTVEAFREMLDGIDAGSLTDSLLDTFNVRDYGLVTSYYDTLTELIKAGAKATKEAMSVDYYNSDPMGLILPDATDQDEYIKGLNKSIMSSSSEALSALVKNYTAKLTGEDGVATEEILRKAYDALAKDPQGMIFTKTYEDAFNAVKALDAKTDLLKSIDEYEKKLNTLGKTDLATFNAKHKALYDEALKAYPDLTVGSEDAKARGKLTEQYEKLEPHYIAQMLYTAQQTLLMSSLEKVLTETTGAYQEYTYKLQGLKGTALESTMAIWKMNNALETLSSFKFEKNMFSGEVGFDVKKVTEAFNTPYAEMTAKGKENFGISLDMSEVDAKKLYTDQLQRQATAMLSSLSELDSTLAIKFRASNDFEELKKAIRESLGDAGLEKVLTDSTNDVLDKSIAKLRSDEKMSDTYGYMGFLPDGALARIAMREQTEDTIAEIERNAKKINDAQVAQLGKLREAKNLLVDDPFKPMDINHMLENMLLQNQIEDIIAKIESSKATASKKSEAEVKVLSDKLKVLEELTPEYVKQLAYTEQQTFLMGALQKILANNSEKYQEYAYRLQGLEGPALDATMAFWKMSDAMDKVSSFKFEKNMFSGEVGFDVKKVTEAFNTPYTKVPSDVMDALLKTLDMSGSDPEKAYAGYLQDQATAMLSSLSELDSALAIKFMASNDFTALKEAIKKSLGSAGLAKVLTDSTNDVLDKSTSKLKANAQMRKDNGFLGLFLPDAALPRIAMRAQTDEAISEIEANAKEINDAKIGALQGKFDLASSKASASSSSPMEYLDKMRALRKQTADAIAKINNGGSEISVEAVTKIQGLRDKLKENEKLTNKEFTTDLLTESLSELASVSLDSVTSSMYEFGKALYESADAGAVFAASMTNMISAILNALPSILTSAGIQVIAAGPGSIANWGIGLGLIAAGGLVSIGAGMYDASIAGDSSSSGSLTGNDITYSANGNAFSKGALVDIPSAIRTSKGLNILGEAGTEAVMPLTRGANGKLGVMATSGGSSSSGETNIVLNVYNETGTESDVSTKKSTGADGSMQIDVYIKKAVQQGMASGSYDGVMQNRYGLKNRGVS